MIMRHLFYYIRARTDVYCVSLPCPRIQIDAIQPPLNFPVRRDCAKKCDRFRGSHCDASSLPVDSGRRIRSSQINCTIFASYHQPNSSNLRKRSSKMRSKSLYRSLCRRSSRNISAAISSETRSLAHEKETHEASCFYRESFRRKF